MINRIYTRNNNAHNFKKVKTYYVCSDTHGFYKEWMNSLETAGFDINNPNHFLIVLGDIFNRGEEPWNVYLFLTSLPKERVIIIKANHEYLLLKLVKRRQPFQHDT